MIKEAIAQLVKREDLTSEVMEQVMEEIMTGEATDAQKASFLTALSMKGETIDEITSAAKVLRSHCERFLNDMDVLEIVGTGGDGSNTINISTLFPYTTLFRSQPVEKCIQSQLIQTEYTACISEYKPLFGHNPVTIGPACMI